MTPAVQATAPRRPRRPEPVRSLHVICISARLAPCGACPASGATMPCVQSGSGPDGLHLARFAEARRRDLITAADFGALIDAAGAFTNLTIVYDDSFGPPGAA